MFEFQNTKNYYDILKYKNRLYTKIFSYVYLFIMLLYYAFALIMNIGQIYINISIIVITFIYGLIYLIFDIKLKYINSKQKIKKYKKIYKITKIIITLISLLFNMYAIYVAANNINGITIILTTLMLLLWIINTTLFIVTESFEKEFEKMSLCIKDDTKDIIKLINDFNNIKNNKDLIKVNELSEEDYKLLNEISNEANKYRLKTRKEDLYNDKIIDKIDLNNDGHINKEELISLLQVDNIIINKKELTDQAYKYYLENNNYQNIENHKEPIKYMNKDLIFNFTDLLIDSIKTNINKFKDIYINENVNFNKKDIMEFIPILQTAQKIIYLYGCKQINNYNSLVQYEIDSLNCAYNMIFDYDNRNQYKEELIKIKKHSLKRGLKSVSNKTKIIKDNKNVIVPLLVDVGLLAANKLKDNKGVVGTVSKVVNTVDVFRKNY